MVSAPKKGMEVHAYLVAEGCKNPCIGISPRLMDPNK